MEHIVQFDKYCPDCEYFTRLESEDPCCDCLDIPVNEDSRKPQYFKKIKNKSGRKK